jgi:hypothetical protein
MIGANMAFHRRVLESNVRFDPALGPGALGMGEETLFSYQIESKGFIIGSAFDVVVEHAFDCARLCPAGMALLARSMGRSEAYIDHHWRGIDARGALGKRVDAFMRLVYWKCRARAQNTVPLGLLQGELQALARLHYWNFLSQLRGSRRKHKVPASERGGCASVAVGS